MTEKTTLFIETTLSQSGGRQVSVEARFANKVALVTGSGAGIGLATARQLHREGAIIIAIDRDEQTWPEHDDRSDAQVGSVLLLKADVTCERSVERAIERAVSQVGEIDILVNNAGGSVAETFRDIDLEVWRSELELNATSQFLVTRAVLPHFSDAGGAIVNVSSINALMYFGNPAYSAAKAAIVSLTKSLAIELAPKRIRANAVLPGSVRTEAWDFRIAKNPDVIERLASWYPGGFIADPDDIAPAICFLASNEARFITGSSLLVDGGITAGTPKLVADFLNA